MCAGCHAPAFTLKEDMTVQEVLDHLERAAFHGRSDAPVAGITCDSRRAGPDYIFVALRGERFDGHKFLPSAREGGANSVISEQPPSFSSFSETMNWIQVPDARKAMSLAAFTIHDHPDHRLRFIAVTGTNGKTTITYLLEAILHRANQQPARMGTVSYTFNGVEIPAERTTPESPDLAAFARQVVDSGGTHLVMEVSAHALSLRRVYGVTFDTAVFTNLTQDHLDYYPDMAAYRDAKAMLFDGRNGSLPRRAVFNIDDSHGRFLYERFTGEKYGTGTAADADFRIVAHDFTAPGLQVDIRWNGRTTRLSTPLTGRGNLANVTQAFAVATLQGVGIDTVRDALAAISPIPGRMEDVAPENPFRIIVDYAHTEDALRNACDILKQLTSGRLIVVFGCGGDRDRSKRPRMGRAVADIADVVIVTSDNPRGEDPDRIIDDIMPGIEEIRTDGIRLTDRRTAIATALRLARSGDTVLLAGKGHETGQTIGARTLPFDDRRVAREVLACMRGGAHE